MTKENFQKELLEKIKPGTKPSDLKKLKRSKSADDIPSPLNSTPLNRSKSQEPFSDPKCPYTTLISQQEELEQLKKETTAKSDTIALLRKKIDELEKSPPAPLLEEQLKEKQKQIEDLRKELETTNLELKTLKTEQSTLLDDHLTLKHQGLKDWWQQYEKTQKLEKELKENVDYASEELIEQDKKINQLRGQVNQLKLSNQSLQKDLNLAQKLAGLRKTSLPSPDALPLLKYALYSLVVAVFTAWLVNSLKYHG